MYFKKTFFVRITFLTIFLLSLMFYAFPAPWAKASCPVGPGSSVGGYIQLDNGGGQSGFLSTSQDLIQATNKFSTSGLCITDPKASIPQFSIPTYNEMFSLYFSQSKLPSSGPHQQKFTLTGDQTQTNNKNPVDLHTGSIDKLYHVEGDLIIPINIDVKNIGAVFVDGDLFINTNLSHTNNFKGLIFVVGGNVNIHPAVSGIDAFIITFGQFCSGWDGSSCTPTDGKLTINGSVIDLSASPSTPPLFVRGDSNNDSTHPGEEVVYQPKYLTILKDIFSKDLTLWKEVQ